MQQPLMLVTGANSGMGLATTVELARSGAQVVMLCRDARRGAEAREEAIRRSGSSDIMLMTADLGSLDSISRFAEDFRARYSRLDVLVNNAGVVTVKRETTEDGFERMIGVNHLGHFALVHGLMEPLLAAGSSRIVIVSSGAHKAGSIHFPDPHLTKGFNVVKGYAQSKLANLLFALELRKRFGDRGIHVHALHPGAVSTSLGVSRETGFGKAVYKLLTPFFQTAEAGASTAIYLALSEEGGEDGSLYYIKSKPAEPSRKALDEEMAARLWQWSQQQTGLAWGEPPAAVVR
ncbi:MULTISPECIES: SDR family oxidoreductase [unclassified Paenibacillus]|uniref:SDR family oxidoreductase n=1 Tax=unclassified Paenibacillus TaxID=185978 RepID=UPI0009558948|nr:MULTISPECIES: SDR family oxidoreductase [unclassified Paenibacillus]ASS68501.1 SDR family oxidoreductase [Paenibacillus sp. RUD330]SIR35429.1 NAD(P)-dependent dehydrogenase, short-chain alcohol dehydrogenase family [Paenibacillus sp. RU4X]SIR46225.1 NAD(P)-dependent dehydrogenase, short-chain alcohol dehydrogenase family [Paenibacillus sp. RU4T]